MQRLIIKKPTFTSRSSQHKQQDDGGDNKRGGGIKEKTPQFLIGPAVRYLIFYFWSKAKATMKLISWKASLSWKDNIHLANEYICDGRLTRGTGSTVGTSPI
eukprot:scaffold17336_cov172-Skeletonema_dohrnii-CCMP3373.AAC.2